MSKKELKKMVLRRRTVLMAAICAMTVLVTGCSNGKKVSEGQGFTAKGNYVYTVPKSTDSNKYSVDINASFYQLVYGDEGYDEGAYDSAYDTDYEVGDDIEISGDNVEQLDGASVEVSVYDFEDDLSDDYYDNLSEAYNEKYSEDISAKECKKIINKYKKDLKILRVTLSFSGCIYDDVSIDEIENPDDGQWISVDNFKIEAMDIPDDVKVDEGALTYLSDFGDSIDGQASKYCQLILNADVTADIDSLEVVSANDLCAVINDDNIDSYRALDEDFEYVENDKNSYKKGDEIKDEYTYAFDDSLIGDNTDTASNDDSFVSNNATLVASIIVKTKLADGTENWDFFYPQEITEPHYLAVNLIHMQLANE